MMVALPWPPTLTTNDLPVLKGDEGNEHTLEAFITTKPV